MNDRPEFDATRLRSFIETHDRKHSPEIFVGREDIIETIERSLDWIHAARNNPKRTTSEPHTQGLMRIIHGAPGVGKTSLLTEIQNRQIRRLNEGQHSHPVIPVFIKDSKNLSAAHVNQQIRNDMTRIMDQIGNTEVRVFMRTFLDLVREIDIMGVRLGRSQMPEDAPPDLGDNCTILLMIDEIQTVPPSAGSVLQNLEAGSKGQDILPVLAGLGNSREHLRRIGLSRLVDELLIHLDRLTPDQVARSVQQFTRSFGIQAKSQTHRLWERTFWRWSQGWPKHLQNGLSVLAGHLLATGGNLDKVDLMTVQQQVAARRIRYYWTRFGQNLDQEPALLGEVMARMGPNPVTARDIRGIIRDVMQMGEWDSTLMPQWDDLLSLGIIDIARIGGSGILYGCPIPSLQSFAVTCTARPSATLLGAVMDGDATAVVQALEDGANIDGRDAWGRSAMHLAAQESWPRIIHDLMDHGGCPEVQDCWGQTPLHHAARAHAEQSLDALLTRGASLPATDNQGWTALHHAARTDSARAVEMLLTAGAPVSARSQRGHTALDLAPPGSASQKRLAGNGSGGPGGMDGPS